MKTLGYVLAILAAPFFLRSAYEAYMLTAIRGPQMLFFSLVHTASESVLLTLAASIVCFCLLGVYSFVALLRVAARRSDSAHDRVFAAVFLFQAGHLTLLSLYPYWSPVFQRGG